MKILALELSSAQRSVAVLGVKAPDTTSDHAEVVETGKAPARPFAMIEKALREAGWEREQIECIAIGLGPGSYTGVRTAIALAQGWQLAAPVKLIGISSVECIAAQALLEGITGKFVVLVDAQRGEFYSSIFEATPSGLSQLEPLQLSTRDQVEAQRKSAGLLVGPEITACFPGSRVIFPRAATLAGLASRRTDFVWGASLEPIYLRATSFVKAPSPRPLEG